MGPMDGVKDQINHIKGNIRDLAHLKMVDYMAEVVVEAVNIIQLYYPNNTVIHA